MTKYNDTVPVEVYIITADYDVKGTVHVAKYTDTNRDLTDLLNDNKRFLSVTNAEMINKRVGSPPKKYNFLKIHMDFIQMVHPITQVLFKETAKAHEDIARFKELRDKLNRTKY